MSIKGTPGFPEIRRFFEEMNERLWRREIDLAKVMALLMETSRPMHNQPTRQSILGAESLSEVVAIASEDDLAPVDHSQDIAGLCVALATSDRTSAACLRRKESAIHKSVDLKNQLMTTQQKHPSGKRPRSGRPNLSPSCTSRFKLLRLKLLAPPDIAMIAWWLQSG